jgi:hypothetical protein
MRVDAVMRFARYQTCRTVLNVRESARAFLRHTAPLAEADRQSPPRVPVARSVRRTHSACDLSHSNNSLRGPGIWTTLTNWGDRVVIRASKKVEHARKFDLTLIRRAPGYSNMSHGKTNDSRPTPDCARHTRRNGARTDGWTEGTDESPVLTNEQ